MSNKSTKVLAIVSGVLGGILGVAKILSSLSGNGEVSDLGCDWTCDNCGAMLNLQPGFHAGDTWECTKCGYENDVSTDNIVPTYLADDGLGGTIEVIDIPSYEPDDPEDY